MFSSQAYGKNVDPKKAIKSTISQYVMSAQDQNTDKMKQALHKDFRVTALLSGKWMNLNRETYIKMLETRKIGGNKRSFDVLDLANHSKHLAVARVVIKEENTMFYDHLTLVYTDNRWQILNNATETQARK
ncbi:MAG: nuclear transport factor 2 family protein [Pseudobacteriovorax sp.]|nr:nuclear transport factor 2 family protein [Pseudobacteriovorax sp.]